MQKYKWVQSQDVTYIVMNKIRIRQKWASCVVVEQIMLVRIWRKEYWIFNCSFTLECSRAVRGWVRWQHIGPKLLLGYWTADDTGLGDTGPVKMCLSWWVQSISGWWGTETVNVTVGPQTILGWTIQGLVIMMRIPTQYLGMISNGKSEHDCDLDLMSLELMKLRKEKQKWGQQQYRNPGRWKVKKEMLKH